MVSSIAILSPFGRVNMSHFAEANKIWCAFDYSTLFSMFIHSNILTKHNHCCDKRWVIVTIGGKHYWTIVIIIEHRIQFNKIEQWTEQVWMWSRNLDIMTTHWSLGAMWTCSLTIITRIIIINRLNDVQLSGHHRQRGGGGDGRQIYMTTCKVNIDSLNPSLFIWIVL